MQVDRKLKTALDESRLLILGAQVLFGFQFQGAFQDGFEELPQVSRLLQCGSLASLLVSIGMLIAPSLYHQIHYFGESRPGVIETATFFAEWSLLPLIAGLGLSAFVVFANLFGPRSGVLMGGVFTVVSLLLLYGLGAMLKIGRRQTEMPEEPGETPLPTKIEQLLTEARVIIPGGQALLGFQFIATLTRAFAELPAAVQLIHAAGLCMVALAVTLLMTPAAVHRIAFGGEDSEEFYRIGSRLVIAAALPLAIGISADVHLVFFKVTHSDDAGAVAGIVGLTFLLTLWFAYPYWRRRMKGYGTWRNFGSSKNDAG